MIIKLISEQERLFRYEYYILEYVPVSKWLHVDCKTLNKVKKYAEKNNYTIVELVDINLNKMKNDLALHDKELKDKQKRLESVKLNLQINVKKDLEEKEKKLYNKLKKEFE